MTKFYSLFVIFCLLLTGCVENKPKVVPKSSNIQKKLDKVKDLQRKNCPNGKCPLTIEAKDRIENYIRLRKGSCSHASVANLLIIKGHPELAEVWTKRYGSGETPSGLATKLEQNNLSFQQTTAGNPEFIAKWLNKEPMLVSYGRNHMVVLVGSLGNSYYILDPNYPEALRVLNKENFFEKWKPLGWATVILL